MSTFIGEIVKRLYLSGIVLKRVLVVVRATGAFGVFGMAGKVKWAADAAESGGASSRSSWVRDSKKDCRRDLSLGATSSSSPSLFDCDAVFSFSYSNIITSLEEITS